MHLLDVSVLLSGIVLVAVIVWVLRHNSNGNREFDRRCLRILDENFGRQFTIGELRSEYRKRWGPFDGDEHFFFLRMTALVAKGSVLLEEGKGLLEKDRYRAAPVDPISSMYDVGEGNGKISRKNSGSEGRPVFIPVSGFMLRGHDGPWFD